MKDTCLKVLFVMTLTRSGGIVLPVGGLCLTSAISFSPILCFFLHYKHIRNGLPS